jgi:hypothetical protein
LLLGFNREPRQKYLSTTNLRKPPSEKMARYADKIEYEGNPEEGKKKEKTRCH